VGCAEVGRGKGQLRHISTSGKNSEFLPTAMAQSRQYRNYCEHIVSTTAAIIDARRRNAAGRAPSHYGVFLRSESIRLSFAVLRV